MFIKPTTIVVTTIALTVPGGINTCFARHTECALTVLTNSGGFSETSGAFLLGSNLREEEELATGCKCHGTAFRSLGKMSQMKRSMNDVLSDRLTANFWAIPNQTRVVRSSIRS